MYGEKQHNSCKNMRIQCQLKAKNKGVRIVGKQRSGSVKRVISFEYKPPINNGIILSCITYAASKLWNIANYERKNWSAELGVCYPDWYDQKKRLKDEYWYKNLPSQTAQEVLKQLEGAWKSYKQLKKKKSIKNPSPPRYKHSNFNIRYLNNGFKIDNNVIRLTIPKKQKEYIRKEHGIKARFLYIPIPDKYRDYKGNTKIIEIIPVPGSGRYKINIIVELPKPVEKKDNGIYMSIDLGVNNLLTCVTTTGKSFIISGRQLLSINRYFDKTIGYYQSISDAQQCAKGIQYPKKTERVKKLYAKRRKQVVHLLHAATKQVIDCAIEENVSRIIIGDVSEIRKEKNMGKKNNQKFHRWPFKQIRKMIEYKAEDKSIRVEIQDESYTSQSSPYEQEVTVETAKKSNRISRGLYKAGRVLLNADCVGAYNILKKYLRRTGKKPVTAVVGLDTPKMYKWDAGKGFVWNQKLAISMAM